MLLRHPTRRAVHIIRQTPLYYLCRTPLILDTRFFRGHWHGTHRFQSTSSQPQRQLRTKPSASDPNSVRRHGIPSIRHAYRTGQNLTERYKRLEKSLRGKTALCGDSRCLVRSSSSEIEVRIRVGSAKGGTIIPQPVKKEDTAVMFKGIQIPKEPKPPESDGKIFYSDSRFSTKNIV
jgi:hypothetical protein